LALYGRLCVSIARRFNAGDRNSGILAWFALMAVALVPVALATAGAAAIHAIVVWLIDVAVLYLTLRFLATVAEVSAIEAELRAGNLVAAAERLAQWRGEPLEAPDASMVSRLAVEQALREAHHGTFAPLFWFLVLPGPVGLVAYPLALRATQTWEHLVDHDQRDFGWFAAGAFHAIDWIPQRLTGFAFAVVGDFEDALFCWRSQAAQGARPEEGIVLASGAGALGVRLGDLGLGEPAREDALASLAGLLWRALIVWMIVYLLVAALRGA
jgi:cobalamin biosynthesis protein CobD/CbiB